MSEKQLILIADDEEDTREILELILKEAGYETITSFDGLDTMDKINAHHPRLVLLDIMMPLVDGLEVCRRIKGDQSTRDIKVAMLSASDESESVQSARQSGSDAYITKPFDAEDLLKRIKELLSH